MAKSENNKASETEHIDNTLDAVLISALRENFEIKTGCHVERNEMLEFLRSVIQEHPELDFVLQHRDTKLSGRIYKAFPKVTTKRVAVPNVRGKKIWTYTNLRRITDQKGSQPKQDVKSPKTQITRSAKSEEKEVPHETEPSTAPTTAKQERKLYKSKRSIRSASMVHRDSLYETYKLEKESNQKGSRNVGNVPQQSYLGRFNDMLKWVKAHYVMDKNSSVQVKHIVESIKTEFKINITYKQSHKLIFAVFPGTTSRVQDPVKIEAQGGFYSYKGIAAKQGLELEEPVVSEVNHSPPKPDEPQHVRKSISTRQTWVPPCGSFENGRKRLMRTRKRFIEACAILKPAEEALASPAKYDVSPIPSDVVPVASELPHRVPDVGPKLSDVAPMISDMAAIERENNWRRMVEELKQERDQAIVERNQAMVSLMEVEHEQTTSSRTQDDLPRRQSTPSDVVPSGLRLPKSEERENPDWLRSLISRSNSILGEQLSEANAVYFPGSTLQGNCNQRYPKQARYPSEYLEIERYEQLKQERDAIWKNWMDKLRAEKDDVIQQLKLDKMEVIQRMELEKSDAVECVEEKLTNQITILTREMRELKDLLNHTMNERTLAIGHAHKLKELVGEEILKESGLNNFPFDVTNDQVVHPPKQKTPDETAIQNSLLCLGKGNKRKQSMPAKLKKIPRLDSSVSTESEKCCDNIPRNESPTVSTDNLLADTESSDTGATNIEVTAETGATDSGVTNIGTTEVGTDTGGTDSGATDTEDIDTGATAPASPVVDSEKISHETQATSNKDCLTPPTESPASACPLSKRPDGNAAVEKNTIPQTPVDVLDSEASSIEISKKLNSPETGDSNMVMSEKSDDTFVASSSEKIDDEKASVEAQSTDSNNQIENPGTVCTSASSSSEKISPEFPRTVNPFLGKCSTTGIQDTALSPPSTTNSEKHFTGTSTNVSCASCLNPNNFSASKHQNIHGLIGEKIFLGKSEALVPTNTKKNFSESSRDLYLSFTSNSGNYVREGPQPLSASVNSNFQKCLSEIPKTVPSSPFNTEVQKLSPSIPRTISATSDSEEVGKEVPRSFEESVSSTFLKYFPELPKSSFNSPLTSESSKYFRGTPRAVCSTVSPDSEKYIHDPGNQALVYPDENSGPEKSKVSSIDFLNSMVENIGKSSIE